MSSLGLGMNFVEFENFVLSEECFSNQDVSYIDTEGKQHYVNQEEYYSYLAKITQLIISENTIKVEQFEKVLGCEDKTAHAFYNKLNGPSFGIHEDPVDVLIECLDGKKWMEVEGKEIVLEPRDTLYIPANTPHRALNYEKALMISYGINDTETLSRIRKND
jgi:mannose-6-phosphate isomerase-like protein (cupin superfamily)